MAKKIIPKATVDWNYMSDKMHQLLAVKSSPKALSVDYLLSDRARRALFFAHYNASLRNTDAVTHHITLADIKHGIDREEGKQGEK